MASILLAEDDATLREILAKALERAGHAVTACENGEEALNVLELRHYDMLIADVVMPGVNGLTLAKFAHEHVPGIRVMFMTGYADITADAQKNGAFVLSKPFDLRSTLDEIKNMLAEAA